ncbi:DUF3025 domain-containing protein [Roseateles cellulosilyticus]|uniref:DUF3025 domain-containing protein n=1 Tax=Pelomonas cellulosilytica TaxID=2906762 RepID=A0ABS8XW81_9BURK|nr:DUF3025 domain-containing protein [Pelomonas sp. P8]MCE4556914.1 DUF3025 domain-containing protein [Pelomonas sp. P8]
MIAPDWAQPWFAPYREVATPVLARLAAGEQVAAALGHERFEPDGPRSGGYEQHVAATGRVPTRDNAHDLFNGLVWLRCPGFKAALNRAHMAAPPATPGRRGPLRDALTLLDESGLLLSAPAPLRQALRAQDWAALFVGHRELWRSAQALIVGHALLEKLLAPRKALCARALLVDDVNAPVLPAALAPADLPPLPVLGIPGWWPANASRGFYADAQVFRAKRLASAPSMGGLAC